MVFVGATSLRIRPKIAAGPLAAAWTYNLGFGWLGTFARLEYLQNGVQPSNSEASFIPAIVAGSLAIIGVVMVWSLILAYRQAIFASTFDATKD